MIRFLSLICALALVTSPAFARDDGGFGETGLSGSAPAALDDSSATIPSPATIEPAAGDEEDVQIPEENLDAPSAATNPASAAPILETIPSDKAPQE